ncbi:macro domain-like protein [Serendipita vermifera]|nr:macro domain-like protein [Serendipita vermifera]
MSEATQAQSGDTPVHFLLLQLKRRLLYESVATLLSEWPKAIAKYFVNTPNPPFTVVEGRLGEVDEKILECECMVSPANSFGIMDGGYDLALSNSFRGPENDGWKLTNIVQNYIRDKSHGYLPPGSCIIVPLPPDLAGDNNPWKAHCIAVLATMRTPSDVRWHKDLVYNSMWSLQVAIENWNRAHAEGEGKIKRVVITGLGTGTGGVMPKVAAEQMALAVKHFLNPPLDQPRWESVQGLADEIEATYAKNV